MVKCLCGPAHAGYGVGATLFRYIYEGGDFAADSAGLRLKQRLADAHSRCRIDGVAAAHQHLQANGGDQVMAGGYDASGAHDDGSSGECCHWSASCGNRGEAVRYDGEDNNRKGGERWWAQFDLRSSRPKGMCAGEHVPCYHRPKFLHRRLWTQGHGNCTTEPSICLVPHSCAKPVQF